MKSSIFTCFKIVLVHKISGLLQFLRLSLLHSQVITSTFQAVLITDSSSSYAVFIYECGGMEWSGATIGWADTTSLYEKHSLSGLSTSSNIGCTNSNFYSILAYRLDSKCCLNNTFLCSNVFATVVIPFNVHSMFSCYVFMLITYK